MILEAFFIFGVKILRVQGDNMNSVQVLISCMYQNMNILNESNLFHDVVVINQCNCSDEKIYQFNDNIQWVNSPERGLSRSRNRAIALSSSDICIISDDDELFVDDVHTKVATVYAEHQDADLIIFDIKNHNNKLKQQLHYLSIIELFHVSSVRITFKRNSILRKGIIFDINMGSGTGNGGGEEVDFLLRCYKKGLKILYYPLAIASLKESKSKWFSGYDEKFFYQRGTSTRHMLGLPLSILYAFYYAYSHKHLYEKNISIWKALRQMLNGIIDNKIKSNL
jgi:glycosyltransferase involved in cell wall biosynthesis